jgi:hypothetical protein
MEVGRGLVYPHQTMFDNVEIDTSSHAMVKVDMVHDIIVSYKDRHFLVGNNFFLISYSNLYDLFTLDSLDFSLMRCFTL